MAFTLRQLQYLISVAEEGTVSGAAQSLSTSQSAVTDAIKDLESDLGVTLFELLCGRRPHEAQSMGELLRQVAQERAPSLLEARSGLPAAVSDLVARLLRKAAVERPTDGDAVALELRQLAATIRPAV